jgi:thiol-disulfide isomerase/thioredoxin
MLNKKIIFNLLFLLAVPAFGFAQKTANSTAKKAQPLDLKVHVKGLTSGECLLAYHYGEKQPILDTVKVDANGNFEFKDTIAEPGGIYLVVLPSKKYFELILTDEQRFSVQTDTTDLIKNMKISGSKENQYFYEYLNYLSLRQKEMEGLQARIKTQKNKDSLALLQKESVAVDSVVKAYKRDYYKKKHPETFLAEVLRAMDEPEQIPYSQCPKKADGSIDSTYNYRNFKAHYWDGFDFTDDRLIRTPVYANKLKFYMEKLTSPDPDSIIVAAHYMIEKSRPSKELFKYTVSRLTVNYETSKVMGYDRIFVDLVFAYYKTNQVWWVGDEQMTKIINRATQLNYTLIGNQAVNMMMQDTAKNIVPLSSIQAKYSVIIFWDPTCSHCKKEIPLLKAYYDSLQKAGISFQVYAIYSELDYPTWKKYIRDNHLTWINVCAKDEQELATAKYYYDVYSTPTMYLTDDHKTFIGKRLDVDGLKSVLNRQIELDKKKGR